MHDAEQRNGDDAEQLSADTPANPAGSINWLSPNMAREKLLELNPQISAIPDDMTHAQVMQLIDATLRGEY